MFIHQIKGVLVRPVTFYSYSQETVQPETGKKHFMGRSRRPFKMTLPSGTEVQLISQFRDKKYRWFVVRHSTVGTFLAGQGVVVLDDQYDLVGDEF